MVFIWDYELPKNWRPKTEGEWCWYLVRKINYNDFKGIKKGILKKYFNLIEKKLDPGKRRMLACYLGETGA